MIKTLFFLIMFLLVSPRAYAFPFYADEITDYSSGTGLDFTGDEHIPRALGSWDLVFVTIGETGHMTFAFDNLFLINEPGNDIRIFTTSHSIFNEPAEISASLDGINFTSLGILDQNRPSTFVADGPGYSIYYEEFDLETGGIGTARYVKVADLAGGFVATDLDAIAALNSAAVPEPATVLLFASGSLGMWLRRKKKSAPIGRHTPSE